RLGWRLRRHLHADAGDRGQPVLRQRHHRHLCGHGPVLGRRCARRAGARRHGHAGGRSRPPDLRRAGLRAVRDRGPRHRARRDALAGPCPSHTCATCSRWIRTICSAGRTLRRAGQSWGAMRLVLLVGPTILLVFSASFALAWTFDRRRPHLLVFGASCFLFCLGTLSQILQIPPGAGPNAVVSAFIYTLSVLAFSEGLLARTGRGTSFTEKACITFLIVGGIAYFYYVDRNLLVRIYILNFGYGLICLATAWRLRDMRHGRLMERVLFWTLLAFAVHFFPRTILTVGVAAPDPAQFGLSPFWLALQFSLAVLGVALALALLAVTVGDVIE